MDYKPRVPREDVNVGPEHPLREAVTLVVGITLVLVLAMVVLAVSIDVLVTLIPPATEVRVLGHLGRELGQARPAEEETHVEATQEVLNRLAAHWADSPYPSFRVEVMESQEVNAAALPGGLIVVTSRLLAEIETENELAFVLGHELGHYRGRHHLRRLGRERRGASSLPLSSGVGTRCRASPISPAR